MATPPAGELNLATLRPKSHLTVRLLFEGGWSVLTILGAIFLLTGIGTAFLARFLISAEKRYEREGRTVQASVTSKDTYTTRSTSGTGRHRRTRTRTHYRVAYTFRTDDGTSHSGRGNVSHSLWSSLAPGKPIEVQYLPDNPSKNRPAAAKQGRTVWFVVLFPLTFGGAGLVMLAIVGRRARKHGTLLTQGNLTRGTVEEKTLRRDIRINNRSPYAISYRFESADGGTHTGKDLVLDEATAATLEPGEPVGVLYLPTRPDQCTLFRKKWMKYFQQTG